LKRIHEGFEPLASQYFSTWKMFHTRLPTETEVKKKINLFSVVLDLVAGLISFINTI
jgi:hypothetical protein